MNLGVNMKKKPYELKTVKQIADVVNEKNLKGFLIDFEAWLGIAIELKNNKTVKFGTETFKWIDDGNWGKIRKVNIKIKTK